MGDVAPLTVPNALVDVLTLGAGGIVLLIFVTVVTPTRRGFYCEDESIRYPFKGSTVPNYILYIYGFIIPFVVILTTEYFVNRRSRHSAHFLFRPVPKWFLCMYRSIINFIFGVVASQLVTDIGKYSIGRLRPNFIDVCKPDIDFSNCARYNHTYIEAYTCVDDAKAALSRVSFPSGHSSFSAYTMLYCAIFIQVKWTIGRSGVLRLVKHFVQLLCILLAYFTALSRVMDNKHHWSDVSVGSLIGVIGASLTARYVSYLLPPSPTNSAALYRTDSRDMNNCQGNDMVQADIEAQNPSRPPREQSVPTPNRPI